MSLWRRNRAVTVGLVKVVVFLEGVSRMSANNATREALRVRGNLLYFSEEGTVPWQVQP